MVETALREVTYQDLLDVPEHLVAEILLGRLYTQSRPAPKHTLAASALEGSLYNPFHRGGGDDPGGWWIRNCEPWKRSSGRKSGGYG